MIKSMTGFGRCEITEEHHKFTVELKSVNHRYLDVNVKIPKKLGFFENAVRTILKEYAQRGKVDIFITYEDDSERNISLRYNETVASQYLAYCKEMAEKFGLECDIRVSTLSRFPEVFVMEEQDIDEKELWTGLEQALRGAAEQFADTRVREGGQIWTRNCRRCCPMSHILKSGRRPLSPNTAKRLGSGYMSFWKTSSSMRAESPRK